MLFGFFTSTRPLCLGALGALDVPTLKRLAKEQGWTVEEGREFAFVSPKGERIRPVYGTHNGFVKALERAGLDTSATDKKAAKAAERRAKKAQRASQASSELPAPPPPPPAPSLMPKDGANITTAPRELSASQRAQIQKIVDDFDVPFEDARAAVTLSRTTGVSIEELLEASAQRRPSLPAVTHDPSLALREENEKQQKALWISRNFGLPRPGNPTEVEQIIGIFERLSITAERDQRIFREYIDRMRRLANARTIAELHEAAMLNLYTPQAEEEHLREEARKRAQIAEDDRQLDEWLAAENAALAAKAAAEQKPGSAVRGRKRTTPKDRFALLPDDTIRKLLRKRLTFREIALKYSVQVVDVQLRVRDMLSRGQQIDGLGRLTCFGGRRRMWDF